MTQQNPPTARPTASSAKRKPIFDTFRRILGRGFRQTEVDALDGVLDMGGDTGLETRADGPASVSAQNSVTCGPSVPYIRRSDRRTSGSPKRIGVAGTALIKQFEGCARLRRDGLIDAYPDPGTGADPWTIGWGATGADDQTSDALDARKNGRIGPGTVWTQEQCDARLANDLVRYARDVARAIGDTPTTQSQFDAMVSFHYNTGAIARATLTKLHNARDHTAAAAEFARWNKAGGRVLKGLVRRRAEEAKLYTS